MLAPELQHQQQDRTRPALAEMKLELLSARSLKEVRGAPLSQLLEALQQVQYCAKQSSCIQSLILHQVGCGYLQKYGEGGVLEQRLLIAGHHDGPGTGACQQAQYRCLHPFASERASGVSMTLKIALIAS